MYYILEDVVAVDFEYGRPWRREIIQRSVLDKTVGPYACFEADSARMGVVLGTMRARRSGTSCGG